MYDIYITYNIYICELADKPPSIHKRLFILDS